MAAEEGQWLRAAWEALLKMVEGFIVISMLVAVVMAVAFVSLYLRLFNAGAPIPPGVEALAAVSGLVMVGIVSYVVGDLFGGFLRGSSGRQHGRRCDR